MTKQYYECHITMLDEARVDIRKACKTIGWTFSCIDGDPDLGNGVKCYATRQFNIKVSQNVVQSYLMAAKIALGACDIKVIRTKTEIVIFDERYA